MNIHIYLEDSLGNDLNQYAKRTGKSRNALIREAVREWISHHSVKQWPASVMKFSGVADFAAFESARGDLLPPDEEPLA